MQQCTCKSYCKCPVEYLCTHLIMSKSFVPSVSWVDTAVTVSTTSWTWSWMTRRKWMDSLRTGETDRHPLSFGDLVHTCCWCEIKRLLWHMFPRLSSERVPSFLLSGAPEHCVCEPSKMSRIFSYSSSQPILHTIELFCVLGFRCLIQSHFHTFRLMHVWLLALNSRVP